MTEKFIPGEGEVFSGYIPAHKKVLHVTYGVDSASPDVVVSDCGVYTLVDVTMPLMVTGLWTQIEEAFTTSVTNTIGDSGSAARYSDDTTIAPVSTGAVLVAATGLSVPYVDSVGLDIQVTVAGAVPLAGLAHVYIEYAELND